MEKYDRKMVSCLQKNLSLIRKIAGWTTEKLGNRIGVTKQTISNLENGKTVMTLTQYIAIRTVLDYEIESNPENVALAQVVEILLNQADSMSEKEENEIKKTMGVIAAAAVGGANTATLSATSRVLLGSMGIVAGIVTNSAIWLPAVLNLIKKND